MGCSSRVILRGRIEEDPAVRCTRTGERVMVFTVTVPSERFEAEGAAYVDRIALKVVWPAESAGPCESREIKAGDTIQLEGGLTQRVWKTGEGIPRREIQVIAHHVTVLEDEEV